MRKRLVPAAIAAALAIVLAACGGGGDHVAEHGAGGGRTVNVDMRDNDFSPASISVKAGEQVQFLFKNNGTVPHDAYVGDEAAQQAHEVEMRMSSSSASGDPDHHGEGGITVQPGQTGTLSHTFDRAGTTIIGCHVEGHYADGMRILVTVT